MSSIFAFLLAGWSTLHANYQQPFEQARWQIVADPFSCQLQQEVIGLGTVQFTAEPLAPIKLILMLDQPNLEVTEASVAVVDAAWQAAALKQAGPRFSASVIINNSIEFIEHPLLLLQQLHLGYWLQFSLLTEQNAINLTLSSIEAAQAVNRFRHCVTQLAPLTWQYAKDQELEMAAGQRTLSASQRQIISDLVKYLQYDPAVKRVLIDGHADDTRDQLANRLLSRERADDVAAYFLELGVKSSMLEVRAHGNRYPVAANQSNRRVVIRLVR